MGFVSITLPSIGQANSTEDVDIRNALSALQTGINGNIDSTNAPSLVPQSDTKPWDHVGAAFSGGGGNNTFLMTSASRGTTPTVSGAGGSPVGIFRLEPTDFYNGSRTLKIFFRGWIQCSSNSTGLASVSIYMAPITLASNPSTVTATAGAPVSGSPLTFVPASGVVGPQTTDFTAPVAGWYAWAIQLNALAASSYIDAHLQILYHTT